jgi:hypothetical protein
MKRLALWPVLQAADLWGIGRRWSCRYTTTIFLRSSRIRHSLADICQFFDHLRDESHFALPESRNRVEHPPPALRANTSCTRAPRSSSWRSLSKLVLYISGSDAPRKLDFLLLGCPSGWPVALETLRFLACGGLSAAQQASQGRSRSSLLRVVRQAARIV